VKESDGRNQVNYLQEPAIAAHCQPQREAGLLGHILLEQQVVGERLVPKVQNESAAG
jgi:hypothetical protein